MLRTIDRYVIREILPPLFLSLLIFTFILEILPVMDQLESLVSKGVSWPVAGRILLTLIPQALGLTIPMAVLVGLLVGLGRLSSDREAMAMLACGVSPYRLLRPVMIIAGVAGLATLWVMIRAIPDANQAFREITFEVISKQVESDIQPRVFYTYFPGWVLYPRDVPTGGGGWKDVLVADTRDAGNVVVYLARRGRLALDRAQQRVDMVLEDGTRYSQAADKGEIETYRFPKELIVAIDPQSVFPRITLQRGVNEMRIPELRRQIAEKEAAGVSPHPEILAIQQRFSFPIACLVFGVIGLALGLSVARESKVAGFVVGIAVIFVYYVLLYVSEALTKGHMLDPYLSRWVPNLLLLPVGLAALVWRARWAQGRFPIPIPVRFALVRPFWRRAREGDTAPARPDPATARGRSGRVRVVIRVPRLRWPGPGILDRYVIRLYLRTTALSFLALMGLFYISTILDRSDKVFKGQATAGMLFQLLVFYTPQYVYFVIPIAALLSVLVTFGLLSRTGELTVMKACGISLYRAALPLVVLGLVWSAALFALEQQTLARANRRAETLDSAIRGRPPRTFSTLNRRWVVGRDGDIYHYGFYDPDRNALTKLAIYRPDPRTWTLASETHANEAIYRRGSWQATSGWEQRFSTDPPAWEAFDRRTLDLEPPDYFETEQPVAEMMTVRQLRTYINELSASGFNAIPLSVELQRKLAFPLVTLVMTLLAIPFGTTTGKRGTLYGIGIGIVIALLYWVTGSAFAAIGKAGLLTPVLAAWAPNILTAGIAAYLILRTRT
jgi:LPS export ABC transporter permease LptG/LPS export ABC transporter permease LptF